MHIITLSTSNETKVHICQIKIVVPIVMSSKGRQVGKDTVSV
jgi:hypothetical protein